MGIEKPDWVTEFEYPHPLTEYKVGDSRGVYVNSNIAYSYFRDVEYLYPELYTKEGKVYLLMHTECPPEFYGRVYKMYKHKGNGRIKFFIILPKHIRAALVQQRKKIMWNVQIMMDDKSKKVIVLDVYGGK
jgi:hypothetical protein